MPAQVKSSNKMKRSGKRVMNKPCFLLPLVLLAACAEYQSYTPAPIDIEQTTRDYRNKDVNAPAIKKWLQEHNQDVSVWPFVRWDIEKLVLVGYFYDPDLKVQSAKVTLAEAAEITAGQKPNPSIEMSSEHHSDQSGDISPWTFGSIFNWVYEKPEKRQTRIDYAKARIEVARLKEFEVKWQIRQRIMDSYLDIITAIQKKKMLMAEKEVLQEELNVLERSLELGQSSDFEISSIRLEIQRLMLSLSEVDADQIRARSKLALAVGLSADGLDKIDLNVNAFSQLPKLKSIDLDLDLLQTRALIERPDLLGALSEYVVAEADLHREIEKQYPDITLSPGFIFDQGDNIWTLASSWVLPINSHNEGPIAEAEARREVKAKEFMAFQTVVLGQVHEARIRYQSALSTLQEADTLISDLRERGEKIQKQYDLGYTDRLTVLRSQLEILKAQRSGYLLKMNAWREFIAMENASMRRLIN